MVGGHELGHGLFRINSADLMYMVFLFIYISHKTNLLSNSNVVLTL